MAHPQPFMYFDSCIDGYDISRWVSIQICVMCRNERLTLTIRPEYSQIIDTLCLPCIKHMFELSDMKSEKLTAIDS